MTLDEIWNKLPVNEWMLVARDGTDSSIPGQIQVKYESKRFDGYTIAIGQDSWTMIYPDGRVCTRAYAPGKPVPTTWTFPEPPNITLVV